ncbi:MAG: TIR domain-containing protein [Planctomycetota bacterium]
MAKKQAKQKLKADPLPGQPSGLGWQPVPGVTLLLTLRGHEGIIGRIAYSPDGKRLASPSEDRTIRIWDAVTGEVVRTLGGHTDSIFSVAWSPEGRRIASASADETVKLWDAESGQLLCTLEGHSNGVKSVAWSPDGRRLASASDDTTVRLWDAVTGGCRYTLDGHDGQVNSVTWSPDGRRIASASSSSTVRLWDAETGYVLSTLEGHFRPVNSVAWWTELGMQRLASASGDKTIRIWNADTGLTTNVLEGHIGWAQCTALAPDARLIASKGGGGDNTVRLWRCDTWQPVAVIPEPASFFWPPSVAFHPHEPLLATVGSDQGTRKEDCDRLIHIWELDYAVLLGENRSWTRERSGSGSLMTSDSRDAVLHTTAKILLVGDSGVGKTGLGWRLAHGEFKEHASTHGQQFWVVDQLAGKRKDGTRCEAVLWDLAGQPDYRLIHALFLDDADLALVLFDPTDQRDPLGSAEYWIKQLPADCPKILVAARVDRGHVVLTNEELDNFCQRHNITGGWIETSAFSGLGLDGLLERMKAKIPWDRKTAVTTTATFKRIKDFVLALKQNRTGQQIVFTPAELRTQLEQAPPPATEKDKPVVPLGAFTDAEMLTAVERLASHGFVRLLKLNDGQQRILLVPELLNNLASSFVLEARRNPRGLGALEEVRLFDNSYRFPELEGLSKEDHALLLDATITAFLENRLSYRCFRESWGEAKLLIFPELMKLKKPERDDLATEEGVSYVITGATENTFAGVVVLLGYTNAFLRTDQAQDVAYFEYGQDEICGVRQIMDLSGVRTFVLFFNAKASKQAREVFEGLVEKILGQKNVQVRRLRPVRCSKCQTLVDRAVMSRRLTQGKTFVWCEECGKKVVLPPDEPLHLQPTERAEVAHEEAIAEMRTRFEAVAFDIQRWVQSEGRKSPTCFVSYAWGNPTHERWVEHRLATDLHKGGITVILDRWENGPGANLPRFVERIGKSDTVLVVGTPAYLRKYENEDPSTGTVVTAEMSLIYTRLIGTKAQKATVIPLILDGSPDESLPPLLRTRVFSDFRSEHRYFNTVLDLLLSLHRIESRHPAVRKWKQKLGGHPFDQRATDGEPENEDSPTYHDAIEVALQQISEKSRAVAIDSGQPLVMRKDGQLVWVYPDGTVKPHRLSNKDEKGGSE